MLNPSYNSNFEPFEIKAAVVVYSKDSQIVLVNW